jgi:hypothetical protein
MNRVRRGLAALALVALAACGSGGGTGDKVTARSTTTTSETSPAASTTTAASPTSTTRLRAVTTTTTTAPRGGSVHMVGDADNGHTVTAARGDRVVVTLNSTYWKIDGGSDPAVLRQDGDTAYAPAGNCVPGGGCGTATASFTAVGAGAARVTASRTSCGEAMGCTGGAGTFFVDVNVQ